MQKSKLLLKNIINENATAITCVVLTTFLFHFSLSAVAVKKRSMPLKSQQEMISKAIVEAETERDLTIRGELLAKTISQHHAKMMEDIKGPGSAESFESRDAEALEQLRSLGYVD